MIRAVGLDPSTESFGVALCDGSTRTIRPRAGSDDNARRLQEIVYRLDGYLQSERPEVVMIEEPIPPRFSTSALRTGEVRGGMLVRLFELDLPFVFVHVGKLKKYATGNGSAKKPEMVEAALASGADVHNDDEADAWWLHAIARHHYAPGGWEPAFKATELRATRTKIHRELAWPALDRAVS